MKWLNGYQSKSNWNKPERLANIETFLQKPFHPFSAEKAGVYGLNIQKGDKEKNGAPATA